jgi:pectate lyase
MGNRCVCKPHLFPVLLKREYMKVLKMVIVALVVLTYSAAVAQQKTLAFPGADGFGKFTSGGRGGKIYIVTTLQDDGPGSFREAVKAKEKRIIVFAVSGNIELKSPITIHHGEVTIAGQSAPGDGICIQNQSVSIQANNVIIRFLRFRLGDLAGQETDAFGGAKYSEHIIIDHCSVSWATDECASFYRNRNFTLQWCIISESLNKSVHTKGEHGYGGIWGGMGASFHHNMLAHHTSRLPRFSGSSTTPNSPDELVDFRNNIIYNWGGNNTYGGERGKYNVVNNYYKAGPATKPKSNWMLNPSAPYGRFYVEGNVYHGNETVSADNWKGGVKAEHPDSARVGTPFEVEAIKVQSAQAAFADVIKYAGASLKRDAVDKRIVQEVKTGTATFGQAHDGIIDSQRDVGGWPVLQSAPARKDTDADGLPDAWEKKHRLNATDPLDAITTAADSTYTYIECYLNELVKDVIP